VVVATESGRIIGDRVLSGLIYFTGF